MELLGIRLFNFVNFENVHHMKLYSLPIPNKILRYRKKIKALKTTKLILFPRRILSCKPDATHLSGHDQNNHLVTLIAAALNWSRNVMKGGGGFSYSTDGLLNAGPTASTCGPMLC